MCRYRQQKRRTIHWLCLKIHHQPLLHCSKQDAHFTGFVVFSTANRRPAAVLQAGVIATANETRRVCQMRRMNAHPNASQQTRRTSRWLCCRIHRQPLLHLLQQQKKQTGHEDETDTQMLTSTTSKTHTPRAVLISPPAIVA